MFVKPDKWLTAADVAKMLGISRNTVNSWRRKAMGPAYTRLGATIRYRLEDIESWITKNTINPSEDLAVPIFDGDDKKELVA
jgi:predicted DNA-binding transcriptional regulator AlpA